MFRCLFFVVILVVIFFFVVYVDEFLLLVEQVMNEYKEKIRNQLEIINYKCKWMVEVNMVLDGIEVEMFWLIYLCY